MTIPEYDLPNEDEESLMDLEVAEIDSRINRKKVFIKNLEDDLEDLLKKIQRHKSELKNLGQERAKRNTFKLEL